MKGRPGTLRFLRLTTSLSLALLPLAAYALPTGGQVSAGQASISQGGNQTTIDQSSQRAVINWTGFNTGAGETVDFVQPSPSAVTLNRISGGPTSFDGSLLANGNVWFINPNGMVFGRNAQVNTNGFLATTSTITDSNFMAGNYSFTPGGNPNASIANNGSITVAQAGLAALVAPNVSNSGTISANLGRVQLAASDNFTLDLYGDGLINLYASPAATSLVVANHGTINANGGSVSLTAAAANMVVSSLINMDGVINANSAGGQAGSVRLAGSDNTVMSGTINAQGGAVETSGQVLAVSGTVIAKSWLLDPNNVTIQAAGSNTNVTGNPFTTTDDNAIVTTGSIETALNAGASVTVQTASAGTNSQAGDIEVASDITKSAGGDASLTLEAARNITLDSNVVISSTSNKLNVTLDADSGGIHNGAISLASGAGITSNGGAITLGGGTSPLTTPATGNGVYSAGITLTNATLSSGNGVITLNGKGYAGSGNDDGVDMEGGTITTSGGGISINGTGGAGSGGNNYGVNINSSGIVQTTGTGTIGINGTGGTSVSDSTGWDMGVYVQGGGIVRSTASGEGTVTITGFGGDSGGSGEINFGVFLNGGFVDSVDGAINVTGTGANTSGIYNLGVGFLNNGAITSTGNAPITVNGTAGGSSAEEYGVELNGGAISAVNGNIDISGAGGPGGNNSYGVFIFSSSQVSTSGRGTITVSGTGGGTASDPIGSDYGVYISNSSTVQTTSGDGNTAHGAITINGTGGDGGGTGANNYGVNINGGSVTAVGGNIGITGTGGASLGGSNYGVQLYNGAVVSTSGIGSIGITGNGGDAADSGGHDMGVYIGVDSSVQTTSADGNTAHGAITIDGTAGGNGGSGADNWGLQMGDWGASGTGGTVSSADGNIIINAMAGNSSGGVNFGAILEESSVISATGKGAVTLTGTGEGTGGQNFGVVVGDASGSPSVRVHDGDLSITGNASTTDTGGNDYGIWLDSGSTIASSGSGTITLAGNGGGTAGSGNNYGVYLINGSVESTAVPADSTLDGTISITGISGPGNSAEVGVATQNASIAANGGNISITGTANGNSGSWNNYGINVDFVNDSSFVGTTSITNTHSGGITINGTTNANVLGAGAALANATVSTADGDIAITGTSTNTRNDSLDLFGGSITSSGVGNITLTGTGTSGDTGNFYVTGNTIAAASGTTSFVSNQGSAFWVDNGNGNNTIGGSSTTGPIIFVADDIENWSNVTVETTGTVTFKPYTAGTTVGVANDSDALNIDSNILGTVTAGAITVGAVGDTGEMDVSAYNWGSNANLITGSGQININGAQTMGAHNLTLVTDSTPYIGADLSGSGTLTIMPASAATTIGVAGGAGTLDLASSLLDFIQPGFARIVIGSNADTGLMKVGGYTWNAPLTLNTDTGGITFAGATDMGSNTLTALSAIGGAITLEAGASINSNATGTAVTLATSEGNFINLNSSGSPAITTGSGNWLIYSTNPASTSSGNLSSDFVRTGCTYGSCSGFQSAENGFLYSYTPAPPAPPSPPSPPAPPTPPAPTASTPSPADDFAAAGSQVIYTTIAVSAMTTSSSNLLEPGLSILTTDTATPADLKFYVDSRLASELGLSPQNMSKWADGVANRF